MKTNFVLPFLLAGIAMAQSAGPFIATGNMTMPRFGHAATLLTNGKVLISGGRVNNDGSVPGTASAELYDPSTGTFSPTGNMSEARAGHTATLLANGKVLTVDGSAKAELYDPSTGTFSLTGSMIAPHNLHSATLLRDGKVLIAGGGDGAELYDPSTETFSETGSMHHSWLDGASGPLLPDGTVLIATEIYHPSTGTFTDTGHALYDYEYTSTLLMDGKAFIAGGGDSDPEACYATTELYEPVVATFAAAPKMTLCRFSHTATLGTVLIAGGASYDAGPYQANLASVENYDFRANTFGWIGNMITGRQGHRATLLRDGRVLITGGVGAPGYTILASAEVYNPPILIAPPALLSLSGNGTGQGAIQHATTYQLASADNPARPEEILVIYCTGLADGSVIPPEVAIGGRMAEVLWFGNTPGYAGLNQINVRVPSGILPGPSVSVRLNYLNRPSNEVTIGVQ